MIRGRCAARRSNRKGHKKFITVAKIPRIERKRYDTGFT